MTGARLDKWLWCARFAKTRSLAAKLCAAGAVTVAGAVALKPSHTVRVGDVVSVRQGAVLRQVTVRALGVRRGPPSEARLLYDETAVPVSLRAAEQAGWVPLIEPH
jgi:ribosome-associated heat shock protein Hsp15